MDNLERIVLEVHHDDGKLIEGVLNEAEKNIDDSDEAMVVGEVISNAKQTFAKCVDNEEEEEEDCVILDGNPDKPVAIENNGGNDSGDLCLVGERGQVACRDYPHPRHLCVKFPFNSTPHEKHCEKCYCYVCDSVAPCVHWGNGVSNTDHCHATEKDAFWEAQRKGAKRSHKAQSFVSEVGLSTMNQVPLLHSNPLMHNQELPTSLPCSVASTGTPYGVMPVRTQESRCDPRSKFQPHLVRYHLQRQSVGHAGTQFIPRHVPFKRQGTSGGIFTLRYLNSSSRNNYGYQFSGNESLGSRWQDPREMGNQMLSTCESTRANSGGVATISVPNSSTGLPKGIGIGNYAPLQPQVYPHMHTGSVIANSVASHPQLSSQTYMSSNLGIPMPISPGVATQQRWGSLLANPVSLQPQASSRPNVYQNVVTAQPVGFGIGNSVPNSSTWLPVGFGMGNSASLQPQVYPHILSGSAIANSVAPHPQPSSQTRMSSNVGNPMAIAPGVATQQSWGSSLTNPMPLQPQASSIYQNVVTSQPLVTSHGGINYPSESPVNFYGEISMSQNGQSLPAESSQLISQTFIGDNSHNQMPLVGTPQSWGSHIANPLSLQPQAAAQPNVYRTVVPTQPAGNLPWQF